MSALDQQDHFLQEVVIAIKQNIYTKELFQELQETIDEQEILTNPALSEKFKVGFYLCYKIAEDRFNDPDPPFKRNNNFG